MQTKKNWWDAGNKSILVKVNDTIWEVSPVFLFPPSHTVLNAAERRAANMRSLERHGRIFAERYGSNEWSKNISETVYEF